MRIVTTLDEMISKLISIRHKDGNNTVDITEQEIKALIEESRVIFQQQPTLLRIAPPLFICGDLHGQYSDLLRIFDYGGYPPDANYLFLGDYVDRGPQSLEVICLLLAYKIKYPENFFILRGNHESQGINRMYGFYDELKRRFKNGHKLWRSFGQLFNFLPIAATVDDRIFCVHGGIGPDVHSLDQIAKISRPRELPSEGLLCDLVWADPDESIDEFGPSNRGISVSFGKKAIDRFLHNNDLDLICRAHQVRERGYDFYKGERKLVTIFSASNYLNECNNCGAIMFVDPGLVCSFKQLKPKVTATYSNRPTTPIDTAVLSEYM
eukprot:TRINITY_DN2723_c0_g2_i1.p1 TRINITY_DN2723_c0_g2~~TRINITY_DN2723_c0_g2_i1.p1  ORF type:complete len:339 (+),score=52.71 TRINITY_DN2723_c0_g2_i1:49-1017(+)